MYRDFGRFLAAVLRELAEQGKFPLLRISESEKPATRLSFFATLLWHGFSVVKGSRADNRRYGTALARRVINLQKRYPQELASLSLITYTLMGFADDQEIDDPRDHHAQCEICYCTAVWPSKYCERDQASCEKRDEGRKKSRAPENSEVARRRARRIQEIAQTLLKNKDGLYNRLLRQLCGIKGGLNPQPPRLEELHDDRFAMGDRIGQNGGQWFIYLWKILPRVRERLGKDWVDQVLAALEDEQWRFVIGRLANIDPCKGSTDAFKWAMTLIRTEAWLEAEEIERTQRRPPGRPAWLSSDPDYHKALALLRSGISVKEVARNIRRGESTVFRWKAEWKAKLKADKLVAVSAKTAVHPN